MSNAPFTLNPSAVVKDQPYDFANKTHRALYYVATAKLYQDDKDRFDLTPAKVQNLLDRIYDRAQECNLTVVNKVPKNLAEVSKTNPATTNMCLQHGKLSEELLTEFAKTYIGEESRQAQDDHMTAILLQKSLTEEAYQTIKAERSQYLVNGQECGLLLLKIVLRNSATDSSVDPDVIRTELANAFQKFQELDFNVRKLNDWVQQKVNQLTQQGTTTTDLRTHLFTAYECSPDEVFTRYIGQQRDEISDNPDKPYTYKKLMTRAKDKYDRLETQRKIKSIKGEPKEEPIMALAAQVAALQKQLNNNNNNDNKQSDKGDQESSDKKSKWKKRTKFEPPEELKDKPPPKDIDKPVEVKGIKHWFCPIHGWTRHPFNTQGDVKGCFSNILNKSQEKEEKGQQQSKDQTASSSDRQGRVVRALGAIITDR